MIYIWVQFEYHRQGLDVNCDSMLMEIISALKEPGTFLDWLIYVYTATYMFLLFTQNYTIVTT